MLSERYEVDDLVAMLLSREAWCPQPKSTDRSAWEALPSTLRQLCIERAEKFLGAEWPSLPATLFLQFDRIGNRTNYEAHHFKRRTMLTSLVLAECVEGQGRFVDDIVNGVWALVEESFWGLPAHLHAQKSGTGLPDTAEPTVDLFAAETAALLAWTWYLLGDALDAVSPLIRPRIEREMEWRFLLPLRERNDFWWMGFEVERGMNNWNPWINSNWLITVLLMESDETVRVQTVHKILRSLDRFIDPYPADGGCDEGPGYWGHAGGALYVCLELLRSVSAEKIDVYDDEKIRNMGRYLYRMQISENYFVNFADASALVSHSPALVYAYGQCIQDENLAALGAYFAAGYTTKAVVIGTSLGRSMAAAFIHEELSAAPAAQPLPRDVWLEDIQVMAARDSAGTAAGYFVAAKGGHNAESHNHNDIGNFIVYIGGRPVIVDAGVEAYSRKTFSGERYSLWTMQSAWHSLPTINGGQQSPGETFCATDVAYTQTDESATFSLDIAAAYPTEAKVKRWHRTVSLQRGEGVNITDCFTLEETCEPPTMSLLTPCEVDLSDVAAGVIGLHHRSLPAGRMSGTGKIRFDAEMLMLVSESVACESSRMTDVWGDHLTRIVFTAKQLHHEGAWAFTIE